MLRASDSASGQKLIRASGTLCNGSLPIRRSPCFSTRVPDEKKETKLREECTDAFDPVAFIVDFDRAGCSSSADGDRLPHVASSPGPKGEAKLRMTEVAEAAAFGPTIPNHQPSPDPSPNGMAWIPGGEFSMG